MSETRSVEELEQALRPDHPDRLTAVRLAAIRSQGRRRRRARLSAYGVGAATALLVAGVVTTQVTDPTGSGAEDRASYADEVRGPAELLPLAARALAEVPGARQVSAGQVVLPRPADAVDPMADVVADRFVDAAVDLGAHGYTGVTSFDTGAFPQWLSSGVQAWERAQGDESSWPVGSTDNGILVDVGELQLACVRPFHEGFSGEGADRCSPAVLEERDGVRTFGWGMGTDDFLAAGSDLELFDAPDYSTGSPRMLWIGGRDGTDAARVELVATDGSRTEATVAAGTVVPGDTMFWGPVTGELAEAVVYDADGDVVERHEVRPCDDPVDCEVR
ncbi:DUF3040 domain-containing protein [Nocardioides flavescens]|uniref:DUF3040 domain-containing protein n=1 Tax=Nocardioides flavescens TaxID=2691959 RepID=A0A6L7F325_9ACTN|nr:DUF3040 domain-containing protein [Nocardioides flavescens]MXG90804.1 DUF3040 domain-containing protein [Nocardioides flavescens]